MRVSWIDQDHLLSLVAQLDEPARAADGTEEDTVAAESLELATLPDAAGFLADDVPGTEAAPAFGPSHEDYFPDLPPETGARPEIEPEPEPAAPEPAASEPVEPEPEAESEPPAALEDTTLPLLRIRERLRLIRQRALEAGLLQRQQEAAPSEGDPAEEEVTPPAPPPGASTDAPPAEPQEEPAAEATASGPAWDVFAQSAIEKLPAGSSLLILDDEGGVLWSNDSRPGLVLSMLMAHRASRPALAQTLEGPQTVVHLPLPPDHVVSIVTVTLSPAGVDLVVKSQTPLDETTASEWRDTLAAGWL